MSNQNKYEIFQSDKKNLIELLSKSQSIFEELDMKTKAFVSLKSKENIESEIFKVMIVGEFKRGKSTFINALLGEEVLPTDSVPCTAIINEIKYSKKEEVVLHFANPQPKKLYKGILPTIVNHINKYSNSLIPPIGIKVDKLKEYVVIPEKEAEKQVKGAASPFEKAEVFIPFKLCKDGVQIIDSPGLNENESREVVVKNYLPKVDAILFVLSCTRLASLTEMKVIENLYNIGYRNMFFICNRFDCVKKKSDKESVIRHAHEKLSKYTKFGESGIFFISAADALDGKLDKDKELIELSRIINIEDALANFLTQEKGSIKLLKPALNLKEDIKSTIAELPKQYALLNTEYDQIERKYKQSIEKFKNVENSRKIIIEKIKNEREVLKDNIRKEAVSFLNDLVENIPKWIDDITLENDVKLFKKNKNEQINDMALEAGEKIMRKVESKQSKWQSDIINPKVEEFYVKLNKDIESQVKNLFSMLNNTKNNFFHIGDISNSKITVEDTSIDTSDAVTLSNVLGVGAAAGGAALAVGAAALAVVGITTIIPLLPVSAFIGYKIVAQGVKEVDRSKGKFVENISNIKMGFMEKKIIDTVAQQIVKQIKDNLNSNADKIAEGVYNYTKNYEDAMDIHLKDEINKVRDVIEGALSIKKSDESKVNARKNRLNIINKDMNQISNELNSLIKRIGGI